MESNQVFIGLKWPFSMFVLGSSQSGKTSFVLELLRRRREVIDHEIRKILFVYGEWQEKYDEISDPLIEFSPSISSIEENLDGPGILIVVDDMMSEIESHGKQIIQSLFIKRIHHKSCSVILLLQNIFAKNLRTASLNVTYIAITDFKRDRSTISHLSRQISPRNFSYIIDAYNDIMKEPYKFMFIDFHPTTNRKYMIRNTIYSDNCKIYLP